MINAAYNIAGKSQKKDVAGHAALINNYYFITNISVFINCY